MLYERNFWGKNHGEQASVTLLPSELFDFVISNGYSGVQTGFSSLVVRIVHTQLYKDFSGIPHTEKLESVFVDCGCNLLNLCVNMSSCSKG